MKKKILIVLLLCFLLIGCKSQKEIYNNDERIAKVVDSKTQVKSLSKEDEDSFKTEFKSFTGLDTVLNIESDGKNEFILNINANIIKNKFKIVLVDSDKNIETLVEGSFQGEVKLIIKDGINYIKLVGDEAEGDVLIEFNESENISIR